MCAHLDAGRLADAGATLTALEAQPLRWMVVVGLHRLLKKRPDAARRFEELRALFAPAGDAPHDPKALAAWIDLNHVLDDDRPTLAWLERMGARLAPAAQPLEHELVEMLMQAERWAPAGRLLGDPVAWLLKRGEPMQERARGGPLRLHAANLVRALCAAGRDDDAAAVIAKATELAPSPEMDDAIADALPEDVLSEARRLDDDD